MNISTLTNERKQEIENIVDRKINEAGLNVPRFDLIRFLKEREGFEIVLQYMPNDTTGLILINDTDNIGSTSFQKIIAVNANLQRDPNYIQRRRFIIAHEYAHSQLHKKESVLFAHRDTHKRDALEEQEADFFARCLLMPRRLMEEVTSSITYQSMNETEKISYIREFFNVTEKKARQRLKELECNA